MDVIKWAHIEFDELYGLCPHAGDLRRWINAAFPNIPLLHQHDPNQGKPIFLYPLIQYKVIENLPIVFGIEEGAEELIHLYGEIMERDIRLGPRVIRNITFKEGRVSFKETEKQGYLFLTPWLAFNRKNLYRYREETVWAKRKAILSGILAGNILSMAKTIGIMVDFQLHIRTKVNMLKVEIPRHNIIAHGLVGTFESNVELPPLLGLGNHVSIGFGTVTKVVKNGHCN